MLLVVKLPIDPFLTASSNTSLMFLSFGFPLSNDRSKTILSGELQLMLVVITDFILNPALTYTALI